MGELRVRGTVHQAATGQKPRHWSFRSVNAIQAIPTRTRRDKRPARADRKIGRSNYISMDTWASQKGYRIFCNCSTAMYVRPPQSTSCISCAECIFPTLEFASPIKPAGICGLWRVEAPEFAAGVVRGWWGMAWTYCTSTCIFVAHRGSFFKLKDGNNLLQFQRFLGASGKRILPCKITWWQHAIRNIARGSEIQGQPSPANPAQQ